MRILLIDDEIAFTDKLSNRLSKKGFDVSTADDGMKGLEIFMNAPEEFDVVLTDIKMPFMDGIEFLNQIRKHDYDTPVVIMSGYDDMSQSIQALRLGAFDYLTKPIRLEQLYSTLNKLDSIRQTSRKVIQLIPFIEGDLQITIPSKQSYVESVIAYIQQQIDPYCRANGINLFNISLSLQEALSNAILHGNLEIPSHMKEDSWETFEKIRNEREQSEPYCRRNVIIHYHIHPERMVFEIQDEGNGFDRSGLPDLDDPGTLVSSGRGLLYIMTFMDKVEWNEKGNIIRMSLDLNKINPTSPILE